MELSDDQPDNRGTGSSSLDRLPGSSHSLDFRERILTSPVMIQAYAISVVVLAFGLIFLTAGLLSLCFFFPHQANAVWMLLLSPMLGLVMYHFKRLANNAISTSKTKSLSTLGEESTL